LATARGIPLILNFFFYTFAVLSTTWLKHSIDATIERYIKKISIMPTRRNEPMPKLDIAICMMFCMNDPKD
jgi:hypothetical protein